MTPVTYCRGNDLDLDEVLDLYQSCSLGARRPIDDRAILADMIRHANLVVTAWEGDLLVGDLTVADGLQLCDLLADLAIRESHQQQGIGVELIRQTRAAMGPRSMIVLLAVPAAGLLPEDRFTRHGSPWVPRAHEPLGS